MASFWFNQGAKELFEGDLDLANDTIKVMLIQNTANWTADKDEDFVDDGVLGPADDEADATNYVRKTASVTVSEDDTNDRAKAVFSDITWSTLGGASNNTIVAAVVYKEVTNDADSVLIAYWDLTDTPTNGSDFTLSMDATNGNLRATT